MQQAGVGMQVLSPAAGVAPYGEDKAAAVQAAKMGNDIYAQLVQRYPDKFKAFVSLPLPHLDASLRVEAVTPRSVAVHEALERRRDTPTTAGIRPRWPPDHERDRSSRSGDGHLTTPGPRSP